jgi:hypothetical protein
MQTLFMLFGSSLIAILAIGLLIAWLFPGRSGKGIEQQDFQAALLTHGITDKIEHMLLSEDRHSAIATLEKNQNFALIRALGDRYAIRLASADQIALSLPRSGKSWLSIHDFTWPKTKFDTTAADQLSHWLNSNTEQSHA